MSSTNGCLKESCESQIPLDLELTDDETAPMLNHNQWRTTTRKRRCFCMFAFIVLLSLLGGIFVTVFTRNRPSLSYGELHMETRAFSRTPKEKSDEIWRCLPNQNGLVHLNSSTYNLPPGLPNGLGENTLYGISWMHQLYCMSIIRDEFYLMLDGKSELNPEGRDQSRFEAHTFHLHSKLNHFEDCFDYLRQKIFCVADMTVEWAASEVDDFSGKDHINGFGIENECRVKPSMDDWILAHAPPVNISFLGYGRDLKHK